MEAVPERVVLRAAQPTIAAILALKKKLSKASREVMDQIRSSFFTPGFSLAELKKTIGVDDNWFFTVFRQEVGITAWNFVRECRLEMAARLLHHTSISIPQICILVGYTSHSRFRRTFRSWCGLTPFEYRKHARRLPSRADPLLDDAITWIYRERCRRGELSYAEARQLLEHLESLYVLEIANA